MSSGGKLPLDNEIMGRCKKLIQKPKMEDKISFSKHYLRGASCPTFLYAANVKMKFIYTINRQHQLY